MATKNARQLRDRAQYYREMSTKGDDAHLRSALRELAEEFEREAAELEAKPDDDRDR